MQNKLVIALLLSTVSADAPAMKDLPAVAGADSPPLSKELKKTIAPVDIASLPIPPAKPDPKLRMSSPRDAKRRVPMMAGSK